MMKFKSFDISHPLSEYVECIWFSEATNPEANKDDKEKLLPTATVEIVFNLSRDFISVYRDQTLEELSFPGAMVCGVHTVPFQIDSKEEDRILGIHFRPGGAYPFLTKNLNETLNDHFSLSVFWKDVPQLRQKLLKLTNFEAMASLLEEILLTNFSEDRKGHPAVRTLLNRSKSDFDTIKLSEYCQEIGLSQQRFIALFKREVGVAPKVFLNICRFQEVLMSLSDEQRASWVDISFENNYFDQAHFNREFKKLSTLSPVDYHQRKKRNPNHVPAKKGG